jgi:predicted 3-demethylubiquinone-9 3-methyltransferase (glyoxalase superfamily)
MTPDRYAAWRAPAPTPPAASLDQQYAITDQLARLGWSVERRAAWLTDRWGVTHACQLDTAQAREFLAYLQAQP